MLFEKYLQKFLGLRVVSSLEWEVSGELSAKDENLFKDTDLREVAQEIEQKAKTPQEKQKLLKIIAEVQTARWILGNIKAWEKILWQRVSILWKVTTIWDPKETEYQEILDKRDKYSVELDALLKADVQLSEGIRQKIEAIKKYLAVWWEFELKLQRSLNWWDIERRQMIKKPDGSDLPEDNLEFSSKTDGKIEWLKVGTEFSINTDIVMNAWEAPQAIDQTKVSLWKIVPVKVKVIEVDWVKYTRFWREEFLSDGPNRKFLKLSEVKWKSLKVISNFPENAEWSIDFANMNDLISKAVDEELKNTEKYKWMNIEQVKKYLINMLSSHELQSEMVIGSSLDKTQLVYDEVKITWKITEEIWKIYETDIKTGEQFKLNPEMEAEQTKLAAAKELYSQLDKKYLETIKKEITEKNEEIVAINKLIEWENDAKKKEALESAKSKLTWDVASKNTELWLEKQKLRPDDFKDFKEKWLLGALSIAELEKYITGKEKPFLELNRRVVANRPLTWQNSSRTEEPKGVLKIINDLIKSIFWIDIFGKATTQAQRERFASNYTWEWSTELWSLSEEFESGWRGPTVISLDKNKSWSEKFLSYGTYQFNRGELKKFVVQNSSFLWITLPIDEKWYSSDIQSDENPIFKAWSEKAKTNGPEFKKLEHAFAKKEYFDVQCWVIGELPGGKNIKDTSLAFQNVVWSTAIQSWSRTNLIKNVLTKYSAEKQWTLELEKKIIYDIYEARIQVLPNLRESRYIPEREKALAQIERFNRGGNGESPIPWVWSASMEFSDSWTTMCSRTAVINASQFWLSLPKWDARAVENSYWASVSRFWVDTPWEVADVFSNSSRYPQYGHRAIAKRFGNEWYVFDPYLRIDLDKRKREAPMPLAQYERFINITGRWPLRAAIVKS